MIYFYYHPILGLQYWEFRPFPVKGKGKRKQYGEKRTTYKI